MLAIFFMPMIFAENYQSTPRIGYTTNYGHGFQSTSSMRYYNNGAMMTGQRQTYQYRGIYTSSTAPGGSSPGRRGPMRSPQRPDPDNDDGDDWRMNDDYSVWARIWGSLFDSDYESYDANWPQYVDANYWEEFLAAYPEYAPYVEEWFASHPGLPNDPFATPIQDCIPFLVILSIIYIFYKKFRAKL